MKKLVSVILIITTTLSIVSGVLFYKPKQANALFGIGDFVINLTNDLKEFILDALPRTVARYAMVRLQQEIARWAKGGFTDENAPFTMTNWGEEIKNALDLASAKFIEEFNLTKFCSPLNYTLGEMFGIGIPYGGEVPYYEYAACTMDTIVDNVEAFWKNPSLAIYGWDAWNALSQPQNNIYSSFVMALNRKMQLAEEEKDQKTLEKDTGNGYKNENECVNEQKMTDEELAKCKKDCFDKWGGRDDEKMVACYDQCDSRNTGICLEYKTKNLGSTIQSSIEKTIGSDIDWLISAKEITDMFNLVFSALFNKVINGLGLNGTTTYTSSQTNFKYNSEYSYYQNFKKTQTPEEIKKLRTDILDSILKSIKNVTTSGYDCKKDNQLSGDVYSEIATEMIEQESQHLYVGMEGVDIKPDYIVLDNSQAVNAGVAIYGETWDDVPAQRYPDKCAEISGGGKCKDIATKLPYDLKVENISGCANGCLERMNNYRANGISDVDAINQAVADGVCLSYAIGKQCLDGAYLVDGLKNTCNECLKNGEQQCENIANATEKEDCLKIHCSNYQNIPQLNPASIPSAVEFYKRCQLVNWRESCNVCLKEYFMPASYCGEIYDFVNRSFVKYPALFKGNSWWGRKNSAVCSEANDTAGKQVQLGLICRILPDFGGSATVVTPTGTLTLNTGSICKKRCNVTDEELKSIIDNEPGDADCQPTMWTTDAYSPGGQYFNYMAVKKAKCCAALWWPGSDVSYQKCRDTEPQQQCTFAKPVDQEPWCYCKEGDRPLGFTRTGGEEKGDRGGDCGDFEFTSPVEEVYGYPNNSPGGDVVYFATGACNEGQEGEQWDATGPSGVICQWEPSDMGYLTCNVGWGSSVHAGVYHNNAGDTATGWHVCAPCNPNDAGYPLYGTSYDQCNGKAQ